MDRSLFRFILRYSKRDQLRIVPFVLLTMGVYYASLDLPKTIINEAIQGGRFPQPDATAGFFGLELGRLEYLFALSMVFLGLIVVNGWLKFRINTMKGWMGERMLRRLRYALYDYILRFPLARFRRVKAAEMATMIKDEVEPLGGFIGEALITPLFLGGQALTAMFFILYQHWALGLIALAIVGVQAFVIPRLRKRLLVLGRERQLTARALAGRIAVQRDRRFELPRAVVLVEVQAAAQAEAQVGHAVAARVAALRLRERELAMVVSRNVTQRDRNDVQQPYNLQVPDGVSSIGAEGTVYDVSHLQFFQGDLLRGYEEGKERGGQPPRCVMREPRSSCSRTTTAAGSTRSRWERSSGPRAWNSSRCYFPTSTHTRSARLNRPRTAQSVSDGNGSGVNCTSP